MADAVREALATLHDAVAGDMRCDGQVIRYTKILTSSHFPPHDPQNLTLSMLWNGRVCFASDRDGTMNISTL
jgi:hypothetical protein